MLTNVKDLVNGVIEDACNKEGLSKNQVDLAVLDATEFDEHIEHLRDTIYKCEEVLDTYLLVDEPKFIHAVSKILEKKCSNDADLVDEITMDILEELGKNNETSRRTLS